MTQNTAGQMLQDLLDKNEIPQALLAYRTGLTTKHVNFLVKGKAPLSVEVAVLIEDAFPQVKMFPRPDGAAAAGFRRSQGQTQAGEAMSTPMYDLPRHFPMPINADGKGPEMDEALVVQTICWSCIPYEDWPCRGSRRLATHHEFRELGNTGFCFTCGDFPGEGNHRP